MVQSLWGDDRIPLHALPIPLHIAEKAPDAILIQDGCQMVHFIMEEMIHLLIRIKRGERKSVIQLAKQNEISSAL